MLPRSESTDQNLAPMASVRPRLGARRLVAVLAAAVAVLAACGGDDPAVAIGVDRDGVVAEPETTPALPARHDNPDGTPVEVTDVSRIIVLNGDVAEVVWALDLGDRVVATDSSATYPAEAVARQSIGYQRSLSAEGILSHEPTVVIGTTDAGPAAVLEQVASAGVPVVLLAADHDLGAPARRIRDVAAALGVPGRGEELARAVEEAMEKVASRARTGGNDETRIAVIYLRGANTQLAFGRGTAGAAVAEGVGATLAFNVEGTVPLTPEAVVASQPDVIVTTTAGLESLGGIDGLLKLPGLVQTPAGRDRRILDFDDQLLLGMGPRWPDVLITLLDDLEAQRP